MSEPYIVETLHKNMYFWGINIKKYLFRIFIKNLKNKGNNEMLKTLEKHPFSFLLPITMPP